MKLREILFMTLCFMFSSAFCGLTNVSSLEECASLPSSNSSICSAEVRNKNVYAYRFQEVNNGVEYPRKANTNWAPVVLFCLVVFGVYFAPSGIALLRERENLLAIFVLNLFLGWTFIGWVISLVWAVSVSKSKSESLMPKL